MGRFTDYLGRVGGIVDRVHAMSNDMKATSKFLDDFECLYWINDCQEDLAGEGFWNTAKTLTLTPGQEIYELKTSDFDPYLQNVHNIQILATGWRGVHIITSWEEYLETRRRIYLSPNYVWTTLTVFMEGNGRLHVLPVPSVPLTLLIAYSYVPPLLGGGTEIPLAAGAVANLGSGAVGLPIDDHDLVFGDLFCISGSTNYNGQYTIDARTTGTQIVIDATYVAETISPDTVKSGRYYTPSTSLSKDCMYVSYVLSKFALKDVGKRATLYPVFLKDYEKDKRQVLHDAVQLKQTMYPVR